MLQRVLTFIDKAQLYIIGGMLASIIVCSTGWYITDLKLDESRAQLTAYKETVKAAEKEAEAKALKAKQDQEKKDRDRKEAADRDAAALTSKYDDLLRRYAKAQRASSGTNLSRISTPAEGSDGPSEDSELPETIVIPYGDAAICAENTARLEAVQKWATEDR